MVKSTNLANIVQLCLPVFGEIPIFFNPLVMSNIAIENGPVEIVSFPIKNGDFP